MMHQGDSGPRRAALYVRVSTDDQADEGFSIDGQQTKLTQYCAAMDIAVVDTYVDAGKSGKSLEGRPALQRLRDDARQGRFDTVLVWKINRLSRQALDMLHLVEELKAHGVGLMSITESFDSSTAFGECVLTIMSSLAQLERRTIVDNVKMGMTQRARQGLWNGNPPMGYRTVRANPEERRSASRLQVMPAEAALVRQIFEGYAAGKGLKALANQLNKAGARTKQGNYFSPVTIATILDNPAYIGTVRFRQRLAPRRYGETVEVPEAHDPIIAPELWAQVHTRRAARATRPRRVCERGFPLTGLLRCPTCGAGMVMNRASKRRRDGSVHVTYYYACGQWRNKGPAACRFNGIRCDAAERAVFQRLRRVVTHPRLLQDVVARLNARQAAEETPLRRQLQGCTRERRALETAKTRYFREFERGDTLPGGTLAARLAEIDAKLAAVHAEEARLQDALAACDGVTPVSAPVVHAILEDFVAQLRKADTDRQRALLQALVTRITFEQGKGIRSIQLHITPDVGRVLGLDPAPALRAPVALAV